MRVKCERKYDNLSVPGLLLKADRTGLKTSAHDICRVQVDPSGVPVDATVIKQKPGGPKEKVTEFYGLIGFQRG